ncbi:MAG: hypothetical protein WAV40_03430 [Microgenomates group bacterium]
MRFASVHPACISYVESIAGRSLSHIARTVKSIIKLPRRVKMNLQKLELEIKKIHTRNAKVEADKAWETSNFRKLLIAVLTYFIVVLFFVGAGLPKPFINALVPTLGFLLSTLTVPIFKQYWIEHFYQKQ